MFKSGHVSSNQVIKIHMLKRLFVYLKCRCP